MTEYNRIFNTKKLTCVLQNNLIVPDRICIDLKGDFNKASDCRIIQTIPKTPKQFKRFIIELEKLILK